MSESTNELPRCLLRLSQLGATVWRCHTGMGWHGRAVVISRAQTVRVGPGDVIIRHAQPLHAGLCNGGSDIIGATPVVITPEMVGQVVAVFTAPEVKTPTGTVEPEQRQFLATITRLGGIAGVVRGENDCDNLLAPYTISR